MAINLVKGQKINLTKDNPGLSNIMVGLGWDEANKGFFSLFSSGLGDIDCDASAIILKNGKLVQKTKNIVYYGNLSYERGTIQHHGDNLTGAGKGDDEQISIDLKRLAPDVSHVVIVVNIYRAKERHQNFGMIRNAFMRIVDEKKGEELYRYNLTEDYPNCTAVIFGELYRNNGEWKFNPIGQGTTDNSISELAKRYM